MKELAIEKVYNLLSLKICKTHGPGGPPVWSWQGRVLHIESKKDANIKASLGPLLGLFPVDQTLLSNHSSADHLHMEA